nr:hypothetical protein [Tanacetum cinerariifolium]
MIGYFVDRVRERCKRNYTDKFCSICCFEYGNAFIDDLIANPFDDLLNSSNHPPQHQTRSFKLNGDLPPIPFISNLDFDNNFPQTSQFLCCTRYEGPHDTFQCQQLILYEPKPCYNQRFDDTFPQNLLYFQQQILCYENYGGPHETFQCQPINQNFYNFNSFVFDQIHPSYYYVMHQPPKESIKEFEKQLKTAVISALEGVIQPLQEISLQEMEDLKQQYLDEMKSLINIKDYRNEKIDIEIKINELKKNFNGINKKKKLQQLEQVANLGTYPSQHFNSFCYDDDDDEEFSIPMSEIYKSSLTVITTSPPVLPTKDLEDSLIMGNEELSTIPEKK